MDIIADLSHTLPVIVICDMLGVPEEDRGAIPWHGFRISGRALEPIPLSAKNSKKPMPHAAQPRLFRSLFARRAKQPGATISSAALLAVRDEQNGRLTQDELTVEHQAVFAAGHETTANLIGNGMLALHRNPDQWE